MDLQGLRLVAVGGASGMAKATAERVVAGGGKVAVLDRAGSDGPAVAAALGGTYHESDVTDFEGTERVLGEAIAALGGVDAVVNTAGGGVSVRTISKDGPMPLETFQQVINLNLIATFNIARLAAWSMSTNEPNDDGERGVIVNTASIAAFEGQIGQVSYTAAKAGIAGMSLTMARDLGSLGHPRQHDRAEPLRHRPHRRHPEGVRGPAHRRRRVPEAHGPARRVRAPRRRHHREPDAQRRHHPPRRRPALRPQIDKVASLQQVFAVRATQPRGVGQSLTRTERMTSPSCMALKASFTSSRCIVRVTIAPTSSLPCSIEADEAREVAPHLRRRTRSRGSSSPRARSSPGWTMSVPSLRHADHHRGAAGAGDVDGLAHRRGRCRSPRTRSRRRARR